MRYSVRSAWSLGFEIRFIPYKECCWSWVRIGLRVRVSVSLNATLPCPNHSHPQNRIPGCWFRDTTSHTPLNHNIQNTINQVRIIFMYVVRCISCFLVALVFRFDKDYKIIRRCIKCLYVFFLPLYFLCSSCFVTPRSSISGKGERLQDNHILFLFHKFKLLMWYIHVATFFPLFFPWAFAHILQYYYYYSNNKAERPCCPMHR